MYNLSALAATWFDRMIAALGIPAEVTVSRWIAAFLSFAFAMAPNAIADEACEAFVSSAVHAAFDHVETQSHEDAFAAIQLTVKTTVDDLRLARFTLGRFAQTINERELDLYRAALTEYLAAVLLDYLGGAQHLSIEVTQSVDRSARDCVAETIVHQDNQDDLLLMWRVIRDNQGLHIVDVATKQGGNTLWMSIELRAQFAELLDQNGGQVDALIAELNARQFRH